MKKITKNIVLIIAFFNSIGAFAQTKNAKLDLSARVYENSKPLANVLIVQSVLNTKDTLVIEVPSDKATNLQLDANKVYTFKFECKGYVSKSIEVSTMGMNTDAAKNYYYPVAINLFKELKGVDVSILKKPVGKIIYNKEKNEFVDDAEYTLNIAPQLQKLQKELEGK
jgi:hypothetical protein